VSIAKEDFFHIVYGFVEANFLKCFHVCEEKYWEIVKQDSIVLGGYIMVIYQNPIL
jgi:hypothetical protein